MGLCISGITIKGPTITGDTDEPYITSSRFHRSLLDSEKVKYNSGNMNEVADAFSISYGSYNGFRYELAKAALGMTPKEVWTDAELLKDSEPYPEAIYHIINFSDCDGFIGPKAVNELNDYIFANYDRIRKYFIDNNEDEGWTLGLFDSLVDCIKKTASNNGYLEFS